MNTTYTEQIQAIQAAMKALSKCKELAYFNKATLEALNDAGSTIASLNLTKESGQICSAAIALANIHPSQPDFEIRNLIEYQPEDLELLLRATQSSYRQAKEWQRDDDASKLDIWCYRIRDAIKEAKK